MTILALLALALQADQPKDVCHVEFHSFDLSSLSLRQATVAEGVLVNLAPFEVGDVSLAVTLHDPKGLLLRRLPAATWNRIEPLKARPFSIEGPLLENVPDFTVRARVTYRLEGVERSFEFEGRERRFGRLYAGSGDGVRLAPWGLHAIPGTYQRKGKNLEHTGDTLFLRLRTRGIDPKRPPTGTLKITMRYDGKKAGSISRSLRASHWKLDAARLPRADADPAIICHDAEAGELLVGLSRLREEADPAKLGFDVEFKRGRTVWTWSGLEPPFVEAPRPPDPAKK